MPFLCFSCMDVSGCFDGCARLLSMCGAVGPGSFYEVKKILPLLVSGGPEHPSFHVVAMSLPGYGFSDAPAKKGFGPDQYAEVCASLG